MSWLSWTSSRAWGIHYSCPGLAKLPPGPQRSTIPLGLLLSIHQHQPLDTLKHAPLSSRHQGLPYFWPSQTQFPKLALAFTWTQGERKGSGGDLGSLFILPEGVDGPKRPLGPCQQPQSSAVSDPAQGSCCSKPSAQTPCHQQPGHHRGCWGMCSGPTQHHW